MGGTIAKLASQHVGVSVVFLSSGVGSRTHEGEREAAQRKEAAYACCRTLGAEALFAGGFPTIGFDTVASLEIAKAVSEVVQDLKPEVVFTHHGGDLNIDHRLTSQAVMVACRPQPGGVVRGIYAFEVLSSTNWSHEGLFPPFLPDTFVDVSAYAELVVEAYSFYEAEVREEPHTRSLNSLRLKMQQRGRDVGLWAAEAFRTLRVIA